MTSSKHNSTVSPITMAMHRLEKIARYATITASITTVLSVFGAAQSPVTRWYRSAPAHPAAGRPVHLVLAATQNASAANDLGRIPPTLTVLATPTAGQESTAKDASAAGHYWRVRSRPNARRTVPSALIGPAALGEIPPKPPQIPAPTVKPVPPPTAAPPPRREQPQSPPPQNAPPALPPPPSEAPPPPADLAPPPPAEQPLSPPPQEGPLPQQAGPLPQQAGPQPQQEAPPLSPPPSMAPPPPAEQPPPPQEEAPPPPPGRGHVRLAPP